MKERAEGEIEVRAEQTIFARHVSGPLRRWVSVDETAGWPLIVAAGLSFVLANSPWSTGWAEFWETKLAIRTTFFAIDESYRHWINDLLLPVFFFAVGLEIKHEFVEGQLSSLRTAAMPFALAVGGMVAPAAVYVAVNLGDGHPEGWGIPVATDIAFALAILMLLGKRVPRELRVLLVAFAAVDDVGGVLIIAAFYSSDISFLALGFAAAVLGAVAVLVYVGWRRPFVYAILGFLCWLAVFKSGVHSTIAGVLLGLIVPARPRVDKTELLERSRELLADASDSGKGESASMEERNLGQLEELARGTESSVSRLSRAVNPWVSYGVLPLFALANAGVTIGGDALGELVTHPASLGILLALLVGKPLGIVLASFLAQKLGMAILPEGVRFGHVVGIGVLAAIGFTVSLFIADLAFHDGELVRVSRLAILVASVAAGVGGALVLLSTGRNETRQR